MSCTGVSHLHFKQGEDTAAKAAALLEGSQCWGVREGKSGKTRKEGYFLLGKIARMEQVGVLMSEANC